MRVDTGINGINGIVGIGGRSRRAALALLVAAASLGAGSGAMAQPIGGMAPGHVDAAMTGNGHEVGDTTRMLLAMQREGAQAGQMLRVPGEQAALAYQRYLDSFRHPIPERFVGQTTGAGIVGARAAINGSR